MKRKWETINWSKAEEFIAQKQREILKEWIAGKHVLVNRLQKELVGSFDARALAVRSVTSSPGRNTAGMDGALWDTPEDKWEAVANLKVGPSKYKALPVRRVWISKDGKPLAKDLSNGRPLGIPNMFDRAYQRLWTFALEPIAEYQGDPRSFGFRRNRSAAHAIAEIAKWVDVHNGKILRPWILEGDIAKCFDTISHEWMLNNIPMDKMVLGEFLNSGYLSGSNNWAASIAGVPQGGIISPILANMTLDGMEKEVESILKPTGGKLIRYADDFVVVCSTKNETLRCYQAIETFMSTRGLKLSESKTIITLLSKDNGIDFLGCHLKPAERVSRKNERFLGYLDIRPSTKSKDRLKDAVRDVLSNTNLTEAEVILKLNPLLMGWAAYHRRVCNTHKPIDEMDTVMWNFIFKWLARKYPKATNNEIYWKLRPVKGRTGMHLVADDGKGNLLSLYKMCKKGSWERVYPLPIK
jgi:RNA-directed DNA polymerase